MNSLAKVDIAYVADAMASNQAGLRRLREVEEGAALDVGTRVTFLGSKDDALVSQRAQTFTSAIMTSVQGVVA